MVSPSIIKERNVIKFILSLETVHFTQLKNIIQ